MLEKLVKEFIDSEIDFYQDSNNENLEKVEVAKQELSSWYQSHKDEFISIDFKHVDINGDKYLVGFIPENQEFRIINKLQSFGESDSMFPYLGKV